MASCQTLIAQTGAQSTGWLEKFLNLWPQLKIRLPKDENIKELVLFFKKMYLELSPMSRSLEVFQQNENYFLFWQKSFQKMIQHVEQDWFNGPGVTFSDIQSVLFEAIKNKKNDFPFYVIIDEFQDTSFIQYEILHYLSGHNLHHMYLVGDYKQAIYGFRGGDPTLMKQLMEEVSEVVELSMNYRSCQEIVDFNNHFFSTYLESYSPQKAGRDGSVEASIEHWLIKPTHEKKLLKPDLSLL